VKENAMMFASTADNALLQRMRAVSVEELLLPLLIQLALIIAAARVFAWLFRFLRQPAVVGEIAAGLVLGPSVLGFFFPAVFAAVFQPVLGELPREASDLLLGRMLMALSQVGVILLLFLVGLEFDFSHLLWHGKSALSISLAGIILPFALGFALGTWMQPLTAAHVDSLGFRLFMGTALAITAIPVLGRIMMELGITRTRLAAITISAAAGEDAVGWVLLAAVVAGTRAAFDPRDTAVMIVWSLAFVGFMVFAARPVLLGVVRRTLAAGKGELSVNVVASLWVLIFVCAIVTNLIGIFAVFGAFLLGAVLSSEQDFRDAVNRRLRDFVTGFFLPIFFAYTGLRTNVGALGTWELWALAALVSVVAIAGKFIGCGVAAWLGGFTPRESACIGAMMNTRGLMELIVINVGKDLGVIPDSVFCMLVLMALITTMMTTPLLLTLARGTELEPAIEASGFLGMRSGTTTVEE
jgi:Kef-type K+ transport system membrane component KefB